VLRWDGRRRVGLGFKEAGLWGKTGGRDPRDASFPPSDLGWVAEDGGGRGARIGDVAGWRAGGVSFVRMWRGRWVGNRGFRGWMARGPRRFGPQGLRGEFRGSRNFGRDRWMTVGPRCQETVMRWEQRRTPLFLLSCYKGAFLMCTN
jgi:hypothetical protein